MQLIDLYQFIISICIRLNYFFYIDLVQYVQIRTFYCNGEKLYFVMIGLDNLYWLQQWLQVCMGCGYGQGNFSLVRIFKIKNFD